MLADRPFDVAVAAPFSLDLDAQRIVSELQAAVGHTIFLVEGSAEARKVPSDMVMSLPLDQSLLLSRLAEAPKHGKKVAKFDASSELMSFDGRTVDLAAHTYQDVDGREVLLTRAEFQLLVAFLRRPGRVLSRDQLRDAVAGRAAESYDRSVDMLVGRLRRKIEPTPKSPRFIITVAGEGYRFTQRPQRIEQENRPAPAVRQPADTQRVSFFERKQMTVLACQLVGLGALAAHRDPEDVHIATSFVTQAIEELVTPFRGKLVRAPGDSLLIYFGYPEAYEDDAESAVHAALLLVQSVAAFATGNDITLKLRAAIATGIMLVGGMDAHEFTAVGEAVNLALHLRAAAPLGGVIIAASTHELLGRFFDCDELAPVALEGLSVPVWAVRGETSAVVGRFDGLRRADMLEMVDRVEQTDLVRGCWSKVKRGTGQVVMIAGEPGIGKSRLLAELEHHISGETSCCLKFFGLPHQTDASMYAVISELQSSSRFERADLAPAKFVKLETALLAAGIIDPRSVGLISDLLSLPSNPDRSIAELSPAERKQETFEVLVQRVKGLAARQPMLIVIEDIQWIDPASLDLLAQLVERCRTMPLLMLIASRPGFSPPWLGHAHVTVAELPRLTKQDSELLLARVASGKDLPEDVTRRILAPTEGVPLFIEELTKSVLEAGLLPEGKDRYEFDRQDVLTIPRTLHGSLLARLDRLGSGKEVAQIGAVIGREFSYELLGAVAGMSEPTLRSALDRLTASELIFGRGSPPLATYIFKHALVRDAAYGMLVRARRNELHGAIGHALEDRFGEIAEAQPELLAHHYSEANDAAKAVHYLSIAGERALSRSALDEAHKHVGRALELIPGLPDGDSRRRIELKLRIASARILLEQKGYADSEVGQAYTDAARLCAGIDDPSKHLAAHYGLWAHHYIGGKPKAMLVQADQFLKNAKRQGNSGSIVTGYRLVGTAHLINGNIEQAGIALNSALEGYVPTEHGAASQAGRELRSNFGQDVSVTLHSYRSWVLWLAGWPDRAASAAVSAEQSGRESGHLHSLFYALWHAGITNVLLRNKDEVGRLGAELTSRADERELPYWQALGHFLLGWHARQIGQVGDAIGRLRLGLELWDQRGSRVFRPICMAFLADAYAADGQIQLADVTFKEALQIGRETGELWTEPEILRLQGEFLATANGPSPDTVRILLEQAIVLAKRQGSRSLELRANVSLFRLFGKERKSSQLPEHLSAIFRTFNEGLETADLVDASKLLSAASIS